MAFGKPPASCLVSPHLATPWLPNAKAPRLLSVLLSIRFRCHSPTGDRVAVILVSPAYKGSSAVADFPSSGRQLPIASHTGQRLLPSTRIHGGTPSQREASTAQTSTSADDQQSRQGQQPPVSEEMLPLLVDFLPLLKCRCRNTSQP